MRLIEADEKRIFECAHSKNLNRLTTRGLYTSTNIMRP
jgi:hypothetical protein